MFNLFKHKPKPVVSQVTPSIKETIIQTRDMIQLEREEQEAKRRRIQEEKRVAGAPIRLAVRAFQEDYNGTIDGKTLSYEYHDDYVNVYFGSFSRFKIKANPYTKRPDRKYQLVRQYQATPESFWRCYSKIRAAKTYSDINKLMRVFIQEIISLEDRK